MERKFSNLTLNLEGLPTANAPMVLFTLLVESNEYFCYIIFENLRDTFMKLEEKGYIDPLLFLVIPRSPKTRSQNIATFKPFPS